MESLVRFFLGLPPRDQDIKEIQRFLPELYDLKENDLIKRMHRIHHLCIDFDPNFLEELKSWAKSNETKVSKDFNSIDCPQEDCPMRFKETQNSENDFGHLKYLSIGGGQDSKPPNGMFFDLVSKSKKKMGNIKEVILTDPYIYHDISEDDINGGYDNLSKYLEALGLNKESSFTLKKTPSPKIGNEDAKERLDKFLKNNYPNISLGNYSPKCNFHDRFYIVRDDKGHLGGVFGPSLNGLNSTAIVLMGDIEGLQPIKKLSQWL